MLPRDRLRKNSSYSQQALDLSELGNRIGSPVRLNIFQPGLLLADLVVQSRPRALRVGRIVLRHPGRPTPADPGRKPPLPTGQNQFQLQSPRFPTLQTHQAAFALLVWPGSRLVRLPRPACSIRQLVPDGTLGRALDGRSKCSRFLPGTAGTSNSRQRLARRPSARWEH